MPLGHQAREGVNWIMWEAGDQEMSHSYGKGLHYSPILREILGVKMIFLSLPTDFKNVTGEKKNVYGTQRIWSCSTKTATQFLSPRIDFMTISAASICLGELIKDYNYRK